MVFLTLCVLKLLCLYRQFRKLWLNLTYLGQDLSIQGIMLGQKLKELREEHQFVQRDLELYLRPTYSGRCHCQLECDYRL